MIRRAIWMAVGAILGIAGYRRLVGLVRSVLGERGTPNGDPAPRAGTGAVLGSPGALQRQSREGIVPFLRDVRAGMAQYLDAHGGYIDRQRRR